MKRLLAAAITAAVLTATPAAASPHENRWKGPCSTWKEGEALVSPKAYWADPNRDTKIRRLIVCVFDHFAPGNSSTALYVASRESGLMPWAVNVGGCGGSGCLGLFQHMGSAWDDRARTFLWRGWFKRWPAHWADPRANAIVSAKMVRFGGWGPWSI